MGFTEIVDMMKTALCGSSQSSKGPSPAPPAWCPQEPALPAQRLTANCVRWVL